jgi:hypothetical protein
MHKMDVRDLDLDQIAELLTKEGRVVLTQDGKEKCAIISIQDLHLLEAQQLEDLEQEDGGFSLDDI